MQKKKGNIALFIAGCSLAAVLLIAGIIFAVNGASVFFGSITGNIADYNSVSIYELKQGLPMKGTVYYIYDQVVVEYAQGGKGEKSEKAFYYAVPFGDEEVLIIKSAAS